MFLFNSLIFYIKFLSCFLFLIVENATVQSLTENDQIEATATSDPEPCIGKRNVDVSRCLTPQELLEDWNLLHRVRYMTLLNFSTTHIIHLHTFLILINSLKQTFFEKHFFKNNFDYSYATVNICKRHKILVLLL